MPEKSIDDLLAFDRWDADQKIKGLRQERPWTRDIIRVLWGSQSWVSMDQLIQNLWALRNPSGLPMPANFRETIQACLNQHTSQSSVWRNHGAKKEDDLFHSPKGKGSGTWAVHRDRAIAWLRARNLPDA